VIRRYDSIAALRLDAIKFIFNGGEPRRCQYDTEGNDWYDNEKPEETYRKTLLGDATLVPIAETLMSKLDTQIETSRRTIVPSVAGGFPCVPDAIIGRPTSMRRMIHEQEDNAPITLLINTTSSAGVDSKTLQKRGTIILALTMALIRIRPVSLQVVSILSGKDNGETVLIAPINTAPLDLATACYVLSSAGFARRVTYHLMHACNASTGMWPKNFNYYNPSKYYDYLVGALNLDPKNTLVIGAAQLGDEMLREPVLWINKQIKRFVSSQEETVI
jgi:hypothetical protein